VLKAYLLMDFPMGNFLVAIANADQNWGLAYADISTGEFLTTQIQGIDNLVQELLRLQPAEVLIPVNAPNLLQKNTNRAKLSPKTQANLQISMHQSTLQ